MAKLVGKTAVQSPETDTEGGAGPVAVPQMPTVTEVMEAVGVNNEALQRELSRLLLQFPGGIPSTLLFDAINNAVSSQALLLKIGEVLVAAKQFSLTGKGPVGHASVEVV